MKFLFIHQNFPGQYLYIVKHLLASGKHDVAFISQPSGSVIPGVRRAIYTAPTPVVAPWRTRGMHSSERTPRRLT